MTMPPPPPWDPPPPAPAPAAAPGWGWGDPAPDVDRRAAKRLATWAIVAGGFLGCVPAAVPGIVAHRAAQGIGPAQARGDGATARALAARARTWSIVGFVAAAAALVPALLFWAWYLTTDTGS